MSQVFTNNSAGYCTKCNRGYAVGPHLCPSELSQQFDMMPRELVSDQVLAHIDAQLPKQREVKAPRLHDVMSTLQWKRVSDMRMTSECGHYLVDREPHYDNHPAVGFRYTAKRADLHADPLGSFETFALAAAACERDLTKKSDG